MTHVRRLETCLAEPLLTIGSVCSGPCFNQVSRLLYLLACLGFALFCCIAQCTRGGCGQHLKSPVQMLGIAEDACINAKPWLLGSQLWAALQGFEGHHHHHASNRNQAMVTENAVMQSWEGLGKELSDNLVDELFDHVLKRSALHPTVMGDTMLWKLGHLAFSRKPSDPAIPRQAARFPTGNCILVPPCNAFYTSSPHCRASVAALTSGAAFNSTRQKMPWMSRVLDSGYTLWTPLPTDGSTAGDVMSALGLRAATAIANSLEPAQRNGLLQELGGQNLTDTEFCYLRTDNGQASPSFAENQDDDEESYSEDVIPSVGELVAAARIQEAKRQESKWKRERESLVKENEIAARKRVENALRVQEKFFSLERQRHGLEPAVEFLDRSNAAAKKGIHPMLGETILDLGYKRVHAISAKVLATIPVFQKQRIYRQKRATAMASDKLSMKKTGLPGIIALFEDDDGRLCVLDGQHRVGMMQELERKNLECFDTERVLVEVFPKSPNIDAQDIFAEINKAEPIKLVDMPGVARRKDIKLVTQVADKLEESFPEMFKPSQRCRPPHINIDNLRDALFGSGILKRHKLTTTSSLMTWVMNQNELMKEKLKKEQESVTENEKISKSVWAKAVKYDFFLGLDSSWLYN